MTDPSTSGTERSPSLTRAKLRVEDAQEMTETGEDPMNYAREARDELDEWLRGHGADPDDETTNEKGDRHENEARHILKRVYGAGVSKVGCRGVHDPFGFVDLIAMRPGEPVKFVQVKTNGFSAESRRKYRRRTRKLPPEHATLEVWVRHDRQGWVLHEYDPEAEEFRQFHEIDVCDRSDAGDEYREFVERQEQLVTDGGTDSTGVEQLPEKWRRRAEKAQEAGHTEKAIAVLDCADELEERIDADDDPEIATDGGEPGTEQFEVVISTEDGLDEDHARLMRKRLIQDGFKEDAVSVRSTTADDGVLRADGSGEPGTELCWDNEGCPRDDCDGELQQQDRFNVMCLSCEGVWTHVKSETKHYLQTADFETVAEKPVAMTDGSGEPGIDHWTGQVHQGDAAEVLGELPESSVHCVMTSPPYFGLRDYGADDQIGLEDSLEQYIQNLVDVGEEIRRVLRDDGNWWLNLGDTFGGDSIVRSDARWSRKGDEDYEEHHRADDREDSENERRSVSAVGEKNKMLVPHRVAIALQDAGWIVRGDCVWAKPNPMPGPWEDRLNETKEFVFHLTPAPSYWFDLDAVREPHAPQSVERATRKDNRHEHSRRQSVAHEETLNPEQFVHPHGKNPGDVFEVTVQPFPEAHFAVYPPELCEAPIKSSCPPEVCAECGTAYERESEVVDREVGGGSPAIPDDETGYSDESGNHQGTYHEEGFTQPTEREIGPWEQACDCETNETEPGVVLDPFAGAGTTLLVAKDLGRRFVGIDLNEEYIALAQKRVGLDVDRPELLLDDDDQTTLVQPDGGEERCCVDTGTPHSRGER